VFDRPAEDPARLNVDCVEVPAVLGEVLVAEARATSSDLAATASSSTRVPSSAIAYRETAPSAKFVVKTWRPSFDTTTQQISLRPLPIERETGVAAAPWTTYEEAAALPVSAPKASVTIRAAPAKANPYGVGPEEDVTVGSPSRPSGSTG
jgi:hypothetical protein